VQATLEQVRSHYGNDVRFVWRNNPLPFHPNAEPAAQFAMEANAQGKFWQAHDLLFRTRSTWSALTSSDTRTSCTSTSAR
jgi:protein-disulfide isomerase